MLSLVFLFILPFALCKLFLLWVNICMAMFLKNGVTLSYTGGLLLTCLLPASGLPEVDDGQMFCQSFAEPLTWVQHIGSG